MALVRLGFAAVVFDCDGVLVDSFDAVESSWRRLASELDLPAEMLASIHGVRATDTLSRWVDPAQLGAALARLEAIELEAAAATRPVPGARDLLAALADQPWAVATSGSRLLARARLAAAGLPRPAVLVTADDVERGKPCPDPYLAAAEGLGVPATSVVVFEDAPSGAAAAHAAGATVVAVATSHPPGSFPAAATIADLREVRVEPGVLWVGR